LHSRYKGETMKERILFVDDDPSIRYAGSFVLRGAGCKVSLASDGRQALDLLLEAEKNQRPFDLLLTDIQMPFLTGTELIEELKKRGNSLPVIALTGCTDPVVIERLLSHEGVDVLFKPYDFQELTRLVVDTLGKKPQEDPAAVNM
jgi:CheY-like chemotaxis protein